MNSVGIQASPAVPMRDAPTVASVMEEAERVRSNLMDAAALADRLAEALCGFLPPPGEDAKSDAPPAAPGLVDAMNLRIAALQDPTIRIYQALRRIEHRIG